MHTPQLLQREEEISNGRVLSLHGWMQVTILAAAAPALSPEAPAKRSPFFLIMNDAPMKNELLSARSSPIVSSSTISRDFQTPRQCCSVGSETTAEITGSFIVSPPSYTLSPAK